MRCKKHYPQDHTSSLGVCASCLRDRLFSLVAAQAHQAQLLLASQAHHNNPQPPPPPPPLLFPRSVSPYVSRRKSQSQSQEPHPLFYSTPQVGPASLQFCLPSSDPKNKKKHRRSFLLSALFRSRSEKLDPPRPSWLSSFLRPRPSPAVPVAFPRGMSPDPEADEDCASCRRTPATRKGGHARNSSSSSGMTFCMSPLVWASPRRQWSNHQPPDSEGSSRPRHLSGAASFCANRSRKLADFGRFAPQH